ncbi:MAG: phosphohistidine phosphatase SixA [Polyangiaceae bacterium]|nr:phosphohistidine phosphatase SixA [Polyangiaceae bacterium]
MALYLVQHGEAYSEQEDPQRGLTPAGTSDVERIAGVAAGYGVRVGRIVHSGKRRAVQTAHILARHMAPAQGVETMAGIGPTDDVLPVAAGLDPSPDLLIVGHLPFLEHLATLLVTGHQGKRVFRFQNGGIVCLDHDEQQGGWVIRWALMPRIG